MRKGRDSAGGKGEERRGERGRRLSHYKGCRGREQ